MICNSSGQKVQHFTRIAFFKSIDFQWFSSDISLWVSISNVRTWTSTSIFLICLFSKMISSAKYFYTASCVCGSLTSNEFNWNMSCELRVVLHFFEVGWDRWRPDSGGLGIPFNALSGGPKESWLNSTLNSDKLEFHRTACGTRCCYCRLIRKISKNHFKKTFSHFSEKLTAENKERWVAAHHVPEEFLGFSQSQTSKTFPHQSLSQHWMLQGLRTHPRPLQLERWSQAWLLLWTSCWCPQFAKQVIKWNPCLFASGPPAKNVDRAFRDHMIAFNFYGAWAATTLQSLIVYICISIYVLYLVVYLYMHWYGSKSLTPQSSWEAREDQRGPNVYIPRLTP